MEKIIYGIDIGGTTVKIGTFSSTGKMLGKTEIPTDLSGGGKHILPDIADWIKEDRTKRSLSTKDIAGAGIGVPGPVLRHRVVNRCVNLGWGVTDVAADFRERTGIGHVPVLNDANAAALGEFRALTRAYDPGSTGTEDTASGAPAPRSMALITIGTGIGCGIIQDGRILPGAFGAAGEIGHMRMAAGGRTGPGNKAADHFELEKLAAAGGITRRMAALAKSGRYPATFDTTKPFTPKDVAEAAAAGDCCAVKTLEETGTILGIALSYVACVTDPGLFVIGGGISRAGSILLEPIKKSFARHCFHASSDTSFRLAKLGNDAGIRGAAEAVLRSSAPG